MNNLFTDTPEVADEDNLFKAPKPQYTPPLVPQEKALERAAPFTVGMADQDVVPSMLSIAEANVHNTVSAAETEVLRQEEEDRLDILSQAAAEAMYEDPTPETIDAYTQVQEELRAIGDYDLKEEAARKVIFRGGGNKDVATTQEDYSVWLEQNKHIAAVQAGLDEDLRDPTVMGKYASLVTGFLGMVLPQYYSGTMADIAEKFAPEDFYHEHGWTVTGALRENMKLGTNRKIIVDKIMEAPISERIALITRLADVIKTSRSGLFYDTATQYFTKDGVTKKVAWEDIINELKEGRVDGIDWDETIGNAIGVLEVLPLFVKQGAKLVKGKGPQPKPTVKRLAAPENTTGKDLVPTAVEDIVEPSPQKYFNALQDNFKGSTATSYADHLWMDPEMSAKILGSESEQIAKAYGLRVEDVLNRVTAKPEGFNPTGMSSAAFDAIDGNLVKLNRILNTINPKFALTATEVETAVNTQIAASIHNLTSSKPVPDGTKIAFRNDGFDVATIFGKNEGRGYGTLLEAKAASTTYGGNIEDIDIIHWNQKTSQYETVKAEFIKKNGIHDHIKGDFFVATQEKYFYTDQTVMKLDHPNFDGKRPMRVPDWVSPVLGKVGGKQFTLPDTITASASVAVDKQAALTKQSSMATKKFLKASNSSKAKVQQALDDGNRDKVMYDKETFMTRYEGSAKDYDIYGSMRLFYDALHEYRGTTLSKQFKAKGYRFITITPEAKGKAIVTSEGLKETEPFVPETVHYMAAPVDVLPSHVKRVWDPTKRKSIAVKDADQIYRLDQPEHFGGTNYTFINVGKSAKVTGLPNNVLKYEPGYVEIHYDDPYTAYHVYDRYVDGVKETHKRAVGTFEGKKEGTDAVTVQSNVALNQGEVAKKYVVERRGPETFAATGDVGEWTKWYQNRDERMQRGLFGENGPTPMVSVIESLERSLSGFSKTASIGPWMDLNKQRYINTFGDGLTVPGQYSPPSAALLRDTENGALAQNMYEYLEIMGGLNADDTNLLTSVYRKGILSLGEFLETVHLDKAGKGLQGNIADWSPTDFLRGVAFSALVPTHPFRQLFQNALTPLFLSTLDPVMGAKAMGHSIGLISAVATRQLGGKAHNRALQMYAASLGTDVKTAEKLMTAFLDAGMVAELDSRLVFSSGILNSSNEVEGLAKRVAAVPVRSVMGLVKGAKRVGFDAGEVTYMSTVSNYTLLNHSRVTGKGLKEILGSQDDLDTVFAHARILAGNQNKAGASVMQQKIPLIVNLWSFGVAQTLAMGFDNAASVAFKTMGKTKKKTDWLRSQPNQLKWAMGSMFLYGTTAFEPVLDLIEYVTGEKIPEDIKKYMFFNAVDRGFNGFLELVTGEKSEVMFAESVNPAFFIPLIEQMRRTFIGKTAVDFWFGATGGMARRVDTMVDSLKLLSIDDTVPTTAKIVHGADIIMEGLSKGWFDAKFADAYIRQQAYFTDKYGNAIGDVTLGNTIGKVLGMSLYGEAAARRSRHSSKENDQDYKDIQNGIFLYIQRMSKGEGDWSQATVDRIEGLIGSFEHWDPVERQSFNEGMASRLGWSFSNKDETENSFNRWMSKNTRASRKNIRDRLENDPTLSEEYKQEMNDWLDRTKGSSE